ncbi:MAG: tetratricopeptide repeat protein [Desulfobaccales bacterium]
MAQYAEAVPLKSDFAEAYNNLGAALAQLGKLDEAIDSFQKAIQIKPDFPMAYSNQALALAQLGNIDKAIIIYQNALKNNPTDTLAQKMFKYFKGKKASALRS